MKLIIAALLLTSFAHAQTVESDHVVTTGKVLSRPGQRMEEVISLAKASARQQAVLECGTDLIKLNSKWTTSVEVKENTFFFYGIARATFKCLYF